MVQRGLLQWFREPAAVVLECVHAFRRDPSAKAIQRACMHLYGICLLGWLSKRAYAQRESFDVIGRMGFDHDFGVSRCAALCPRT